QCMLQWAYVFAPFAVDRCLGWHRGRRENIPDKHIARCVTRRPHGTDRPGRRSILLDESEHGIPPLPQPQDRAGQAAPNLHCSTTVSVHASRDQSYSHLELLARSASSKTRDTFGYL